MFFGRRTNWRVAKSLPQTLGLSLLSAGLLVGCGETSTPLAEIYESYEPAGAWSQPQGEVTPVAWLPPPRPQATSQVTSHSQQPDLAPPRPLADYPYEEAYEEKATVFRLPTLEPELIQEETPIQLKSLPANEVSDTSRNFSILVPLPPVEEIAEEIAENVVAETVIEEDVVAEMPLMALPSLEDVAVIEEETAEEPAEIVVAQLPAIEEPAIEESQESIAAIVLGPVEEPVGEVEEVGVEKIGIVTEPLLIAMNSVEQPVQEPIALLLPPQPIVVVEADYPKTPETPPTEQFAPAEVTQQQAAPPFKLASQAELLAIFGKSPLPVLADLTQQKQLLESLSQNSSAAVTGVLTDSRVNELAKTKIQQAYAMAGRGALYVARQELVEVLRMISQAKDAQQGTPKRSRSLAAGLRALREADDFAPRGTQLEAELDISVLCASHRTPIAKQADAANLLPSLMMDRYFRYAQLQLAVSVAGEPAGSMALHALGKLNSQLGRVEPQKNRLADRHAIAYQQAALLAHNQNHLAAHELGVLLATSGHYAEAEQLLKHVADRESNAVVYRNLARVQEKMGQSGQALASRDHARQLSQQGVTGTSNVQWVSPNQFAQGGTQIPRYNTAPTTAPTTARRPQHTTPQPAIQATHQLVVPGSRQARQPSLRR